MRWTVRKHRQWLVATVAVATFALLSLGGCAYFKDWEHLPRNRDDQRTIYVVSHGWHTGIVIARDRLGAELAFVPQQLGESAFYEFGWGDKDFYQTEGFPIGIALKAVFWPTEATMHVVAVPELPAVYFPDSATVELRVSVAGHSKLTAAIARSFAKDASGDSTSTRDGLYGHSRFFDATGSYHAFNTCNTWTARTLAQAGVPTTTVFTITAGGVVRQSKWAAAKYSCCDVSPAL